MNGCENVMKQFAKDFVTKKSINVYNLLQFFIC